MNAGFSPLEFGSTGVGSQWPMRSLPARLKRVCLDVSFPVGEISRSHGVMVKVYLPRVHCEEIALAKHGCF